MPADIALLPKAQQMLLYLKDSDATGRTLVERIGEFFPQATDFEWLTNPDSKTFLEVFYNEESSTGWLTGDEYNKFWGYAADYSDYLENQDPSQVAFEGRTGLTAFLDPVLVHWETAAQQSVTTVDPETIGKVDGYPGWWQGYDSQERVWKYRQSADIPGDGADGWLVGAQVNWNEQRAKNILSTALARHPSLDRDAAWAAIWDAVSKTQADDETIISNVLASQRPTRVMDPETIGKVDGYPGWWQGYDSQERVWKYRQSTEKPGDGADGWLVQVNWNEQRAKNIYSTALTRHPDLDQAAAWAAIWEAVSKTQADDETIISNVLASQRPPVAAQQAAQQVPEAVDPLPTRFTQDIRAAIIPITDEFMRRLPPDIASNKAVRDVAEQRFLKEAVRIAAREAGQEG